MERSEERKGEEKRKKNRGGEMAGLGVVGQIGRWRPDQLLDCAVQYAVAVEGIYYAYC